MKICHSYILVSWLLVVRADVVPPLSCHSPFREYVFLGINKVLVSQLAEVDPGEELVLEAVNLRDNTTKKSKRCQHRGNFLKCMLWRLKQTPAEAEYRLQLTTSDASLLWRYNNNTFKLRQDLYYCFEHKFEIFSSFDVNDTSIQVQWRTRRGDEAHNLIQHHTISAESADGKHHGGHVLNEDCELLDAKRLCKAVVTGLKPCTKYRICVDTQFIEQTHHQCIEQMVVTLCSHEPEAADNFVIYVAAGAIALFLGVLGFMLIHRSRSSSAHAHEQRRRDEVVVMEQDVVMPRLEGPEYAEIPDEDEDRGGGGRMGNNDYFVVTEGTSPIL